MDLSYVLFDTQPTGTAAFDAILFQNAQGADATHTEDFTNMRGAGSLPSSEKFTLNKLSVAFSPAITPADIIGVATASLIQVRLYDQVVLYLPLAFAFDESAYSGFNNLAAAAGLQVTGIFANGFMLDKPIEIPGGAKFAVRIKTTVATAASTKLIVGLNGTLSLP